MGGYGSTRWPSDYRARMYVESCLPLKIRDLHLRDNKTVQAKVQGINEKGEVQWDIPLEICSNDTGRILTIAGKAFLLTQSHRNEWFGQCCEMRVRRLYRHPSGAWGCRRCLGLAYSSQWRNYRTIRRLIGRFI